MENELPQVLESRSAAVELESARSMGDTQNALVIAKRFPRDEIAAETRILNSCKRVSLAKQASYKFPRGGESVTGPSIRLAETIAQNWGNLIYGFKEIEQIEGSSVVEAFCWDLETNTRQSRQFTVAHKISKKDGTSKILRDPRDIYEIVANQAQRRVRAAILGILPGDVVEKAVTACRKTLAIGDKSEPLIDRIKRMVLAFQELGISKDLLEKRIEHPVDAIITDELVDLQEIYNSIKDSHSKREDWFDIKSSSSEGTKAAELNAKFAKKKEEPKKEAVPKEGDFENFKG